MTSGLYSVGMAIKSAQQTERRRRESQQAYRDKARQLMRKQRPDNLDEDEKELLASIERQLLDKSARVGVSCPECEQAMCKARVHGVTIDCCPDCGSLWFDPGELAELAEAEDDIPGHGAKSRPGKHPCPVCGEQMIEHPYHRMYNLLVDRCPTGHGIYLEEGELRRALEIT